MISGGHNDLGLAQGGFDGQAYVLARVVAVREDGARTVRFEGSLPLGGVLVRFGDVPLPPCVGPGDAARAARYQTMFARVPGSVAAPTASLHFTPRVFERIRAMGVAIAPLTSGWLHDQFAWARRVL